MSNSSTVSINTYNKGKFMMKRKNVVLHLYEARKFASGAILEKTWSNSLFFPFFLVHYKCHTVNMLSFSFLQPKLVKLNAKFKTKVFSFTRITSRLVFGSWHQTTVDCIHQQLFNTPRVLHTGVFKWSIYINFNALGILLLHFFP